MDPRLSIVVVTPTYPTRTSYAGIFVADQVAALRSSHDVEVVAPEPRGWRAALRAAGPSEPDDDTAVARPVARTWIPRSGRSVSMGYVRALEEVFGARGRRLPDLIHAHVTYPIGYAAVVVGARHGVPVVITEHSGPFDAVVPTAFARRSARWALLHAGAVLTVGPDLRDRLAAFAPGLEPKVVGNVVDTEFFTPSGAPRRPGPLRLLAVGIQMPQKGVDVLLVAVQLLVARGCMFELQIVGDGVERGPLEDAAQELGVSSVVRFVGSVHRERLRDVMCDADILVSASRMETFGLAIAEAIACERPVVATRSGGAEWVIPEGAGILVEPDDAKGLADAIEDVGLGQVDLDLSLARATIVSRFSPPVVVSALEDVYSEVLAREARIGGG